MFDRGAFDRLAFDRGGEAASSEIEIMPFVINFGAAAELGIAYHSAVGPMTINLGMSDVQALRALLGAPDDMLLALDMAVELDALRSNQANVSVMIPPGGILVIDTDPNQRWVTLDGVIVNEEYSGQKWFTIDPNTMSFEINCAANRTLDVQIEYTEMWY